MRFCAGSDGIRDTWGPYGNADMLERAKILGLRNNLRHDAQVEMALAVVTTGGAAMMRLDSYGIAPGCHADLVLLEGETLTEAVVSHPARRLVVKRGKVVARNGAPIMSAP